MKIAKLSLTAVLAVWCCAQTTKPQTRDFTLLEGRGQLLSFQHDVKTVAISEPKIADAVVISPREVMVNAKGLGRATLIIWDNATSAVIARYNVAVGPDVTE